MSVTDLRLEDPAPEHVAAHDDPARSPPWRPRPRCGYVAFAAQRSLNDTKVARPRERIVVQLLWVAQAQEPRASDLRDPALRDACLLSPLVYVRDIRIVAEEAVDAERLVSDPPICQHAQIYQLSVPAWRTRVVFTRGAHSAVLACRHSRSGEVYDSVAVWKAIRAISVTDPRGLEQEGLVVECPRQPDHRVIPLVAQNLRAVETGRSLSTARCSDWRREMHEAHDRASAAAEAELPTGEASIGGRQDAIRVGVDL